MYPDPELRDLQVRALKRAELVRGWSGSKPFQIPANVDRSESQFNIQQDFPEEASYTIQFNILPIGDMPAPITPRARAEIFWTVGGNSMRRLIDIASGAAISGTAKGVNVKITDNSIYSGAPHPEAEYRVSAQIAPGTRPILGGVQPPILVPDDPRDTFFDIAAGAPAVIVNFPQDAGVIAYYLVVSQFAFPLAPTNEIQVNQVSPGGGSIGGFVNYDGTGKWQPFMPGAGAVRISNQNAYTIRCSLLWGIEG